MSINKGKKKIYHNNRTNTFTEYKNLNNTKNKHK